MNKIIEVEEVLKELPDEIRERVGQIFDGYLGLNLREVGYDLGTEALVWPKNVTGLSSMEVGELQGKLAGWYSYYVDRLKFLKVAVQVLEEEVRKEYAKSFLMSDGKMAVEAKKLLAEISPGYRIMKYHLVRVKGVVTMIEDDVEKLDRIMAVLSREISRREVTGGY